MTGVRFVYFDLDDTLLDHRRAESLALADLHRQDQVLRDFDIEQVRSAYRVVNSRVWREYSAGKRDKEGTRSGRFELLFESLGVRGNALTAADDYLSAYAHHWSLVEGSLDAYRRVSRRYPVGLLTNGFAEAQRAKLRRFPELAECTETVLISEEVGVMKPQTELFRIAENLAGASADSIVYVGDSLHSDIEGGLAAGWRVLWYNVSGESGPSGVPSFSHWSALPDLLGL